MKGRRGGGGGGGGDGGGGGGQGRQTDLPSTTTNRLQGGGDGGGGDGGGGQSHFTGSLLSIFRRSSIGKSGSPIHCSGVRVRVRGLGSSKGSMSVATC